MKIFKLSALASLFTLCGYVQAENDNFYNMTYDDRTHYNCSLFLDESGNKMDGSDLQTSTPYIHIAVDVSGSNSKENSASKRVLFSEIRAVSHQGGVTHIETKLKMFPQKGKGTLSKLLAFRIGNGGMAEEIIKMSYVYSDEGNKISPGLILSRGSKETVKEAYFECKEN